MKFTLKYIQATKEKLHFDFKKNAICNLCLHVCVFSCFCFSESRKSCLNKRVSELEDVCRVKEAERVDLELRLTQIQENVKKSLTGGVLGAPVEAKPPIKVTFCCSNTLHIQSNKIACMHIYY